MRSNSEILILQRQITIQRPNSHLPYFENSMSMKRKFVTRGIMPANSFRVLDDIGKLCHKQNALSFNNTFQK